MNETFLHVFQIYLLLDVNDLYIVHLGVQKWRWLDGNRTTLYIVKVNVPLQKKLVPLVCSHGATTWPAWRTATTTTCSPTCTRRRSGLVSNVWSLKKEEGEGEGGYLKSKSIFFSCSVSFKALNSHQKLVSPVNLHTSSCLPENWNNKNELKTIGT